MKINEPKDKDPLSAMKDAYEKQMIEMKREMKKNMEKAEQKRLAQLKENAEISMRNLVATMRAMFRSMVTLKVVVLIR